MLQKTKLLELASKYKINYTQWKQSSDTVKKYDVVVVGGGVIGTATAREISNRHRNMKMAILEKENRLAAHQSGHNSGVLHAGIYYTPGSLKAKLCVQGQSLAYKYFDEKKIPYKKCGKLIVATNPIELERLKDLYERGLKNEVRDMQMISQEKIHEIEPYCDGLGAIWSPHTGIADFALVTKYLAKDFRKNGGDIYLNFEADTFIENSEDSEYPVMVIAKDGQQVDAKHVLTCAGLHSDRLAVKTGCSSDPKIVTFRGEYLVLNPERRHMVKGNIYPVPDPKFPFLGVHCTPRMDGSIWLGPNAILSFKREGYRWGDISITDMLDVLGYRGFQKLAFRYAKYGIKEMTRSAFIPLQVAQLNRFLPDLIESDVSRGPAGVRAQAMDNNGNLVDDFVFDKGNDKFNSRILHCRNAPSPGATSSLAIAKMVADKMEEQFQM